MDCRQWPTTGFTAALRGGSQFIGGPSSSRGWSVAPMSKPPVDSGAHAEIRHALQGGVVHADGQVRAEFGAQPPGPCEADLRAQKNRGDAGVVGLFALESVASLAFSGNIQLQSDGVILVQGEEDAGTAPRGQVICVAIVKIAFRTNAVLRIRADKETVPACKQACADDPVKRAAAQGEVVPMNAAFSRAGRRGQFVQLLLQSVAVASGELDATVYRPGKSALFGRLAESQEIGDERNVADARLTAAVDFARIIGPLKRAIDNRHIDLKTEPLGEVVTDENLRNRT